MQEGPRNITRYVKWWYVYMKPFHPLNPNICSQVESYHMPSHSVFKVFLLHSNEININLQTIIIGFSTPVCEGLVVPRDQYGIVHTSYVDLIGSKCTFSLYVNNNNNNNYYYYYYFFLSFQN